MTLIPDAPMLEQEALADRTRRGRTSVRVFSELTKLRINSMVVLTTAAAMVVGGTARVGAFGAVAALLGTYLLAAASAALNMVLERDVDARMERTAGRPLPAGHISPRAATTFGLVLAVLGTIVLVLWCHPLVAVLGLLALALYLLVYTPLKRITPWSTHLGAVPGAIPVLMGFAAGLERRGSGDWRPAALVAELASLPALAWVMFGVLLFWQLPHFFAIAWRCRDDYQRGALAMLSVGDPSGRRTAFQTVLFTTVLVAISMLPLSLGSHDGYYLVPTALAGAGFLVMSARFALDRSSARALQLMLYSVIYLPVVMVLLVATRAR